MEMYIGSKEEVVGLLKDGMSVEQVSKETGLPTDFISDILDDLLIEEIFSPFETVNS